MDNPEVGIDDPTGRSLYDADRDIVMGHEFVGEVIGHGPGVQRRVPIGARVTSMPIRLDPRWRRWLADHRTASRGAREFRGTTGRAGGDGEAVEGDDSSDASPFDASRSASSMFGRRGCGRVRRHRDRGGGGWSFRCRRLGQRWHRADHRGRLQGRTPRAARERFGAHVLVDPAEIAVRRL